MLDHVSLRVADYARSKAFYEKALAPLGYKVAMEFGQAAGFSQGKMPDFWLGAGTATGGVHLAFTADDHRQVDAFYEAAIAAGAKDNGKPGPRRDYHPNYYGAFVIDPDGNNIEAVCHKPM